MCYIVFDTRNELTDQSLESCLLRSKKLYSPAVWFYNPRNDLTDRSLGSCTFFDPKNDTVMLCDPRNDAAIFLQRRLFSLIQKRM